MDINKDLELQYKSEKGFRPNDDLVEPHEMTTPFGGHKVEAFLLSDIPGYFLYDDGICHYLNIPNPDYIKWLEEKVLELQKLNPSTLQ